MCILFAVTFPERTEALITVGSLRASPWAPDYPFGRQPQQQEDFVNSIRERWASRSESRCACRAWRKTSVSALGGQKFCAQAAVRRRCKR